MLKNTETVTARRSDGSTVELSMIAAVILLNKRIDAVVDTIAALQQETEQ